MYVDRLQLLACSQILQRGEQVTIDARRAQRNGTANIAVDVSLGVFEDGDLPKISTSCTGQIRHGNGDAEKRSRDMARHHTFFETAS